MQGLSPKLPLSYSSTDWFYGLNHTVKELMAQNLKHLVLTSPGERMMMPHFGVGLRHFLFLNENDIRESLSTKISEQAERYLPFIKILNIEFLNLSNRETSNSLTVKIHYMVESLNDIEVLDVTSQID